MSDLYLDCRSLSKREEKLRSYGYWKEVADMMQVCFGCHCIANAKPPPFFCIQCCYSRLLCAINRLAARPLYKYQCTLILRGDLCRTTMRLQGYWLSMER